MSDVVSQNLFAFKSCENQLRNVWAAIKKKFKKSQKIVLTNPKNSRFSKWIKSQLLDNGADRVFNPTYLQRALYCGQCYKTFVTETARISQLAGFE